MSSYDTLSNQHPLNLWLQNAEDTNKNNKKLKNLNEQNISIIDKKIAEQSKDEFIDEIGIVNQYLDLLETEYETNKRLKTLQEDLKQKLYDKYPKLTEEEVKTLVVKDKWLTTIKQRIDTEIDHISQRLTHRIE